MKIYSRNILKVGLSVWLPTMDDTYINGCVLVIKGDNVIVGINKSSSFYGLWNRKLVMDQLSLDKLEDYEYYIPFIKQGCEDFIESGYWKINDNLSLIEVVKQLGEDVK